MVGSLHQDKVERLQSAFSSTGKTLFLATKWNKKNEIRRTSCWKQRKMSVSAPHCTWLNNDSDLGGVLLSGWVSHSQLEGVVALLHGRQLQGWCPYALELHTHTHTHSYLICSNEVNHRLGRVRLWFWRFSPASPPLCPCSRGWGTTRRTGSRGRRCFGCRSEWWSCVAAGWPGLNHNNIKCCLFNTRVV